MAITQTGAMFKALTFDNKSSRSYGVYITGEAVYNAPERDVEMITIPGRNGAFALDNGRFENITVTYPAGIFAENEADFAQAISDFRNYLCSKKGYCRLTDEYNPNEYRMAIYKSGLEVTPAQLRAGEFDIIFECKPQRFLTSGETATAVVSGNTLTNPTLFESSPLLEVTGYGNIDIADAHLEVHNEPIGTIGINKTETKVTYTYTIKLETQYANSGDAIHIYTTRGSFRPKITKELTAGVGNEFSSVSVSYTGSGTAGYSQASSPSKQISGILYPAQFDMAYGTASSDSMTATWSFNNSKTYKCTLTTAYNGSDTVTITAANTTTTSPLSVQSTTFYIPFGVTLDSTQTALGNPLYIDLDIGEAYKIENGVPVSVNNGVELPGELPVLEPGANTITYDNTFTQFKVVPRWWII